MTDQPPEPSELEPLDLVAPVWGGTWEGITVTWETAIFRGERIAGTFREEVETLGLRLVVWGFVVATLRPDPLLRLRGRPGSHRWAVVEERYRWEAQALEAPIFWGVTPTPAEAFEAIRLTLAHEPPAGAQELA